MQNLYNIQIIEIRNIGPHSHAANGTVFSGNKNCAQSVKNPVLIIGLIENFILYWALK
jgi:hypothetical protein